LDDRQSRTAQDSELHGSRASISLPGSMDASEHVGGPRITLAAPPSPAEGLRRADRDLALRVVTSRDPTLPWWSLHLSGAQVFPGGDGPSTMIKPTGTVSPLLVSGAGEIVAAVWTSPNGATRHYIVPWLPSWSPLLEWLGLQAIPEFVPAAARRFHSRLGEEPQLQTTAELSAPDRHAWRD